MDLLYSEQLQSLLVYVVYDTQFFSVTIFSVTKCMMPSFILSCVVHSSQQYHKSHMRLQICGLSSLL